MSEKKITNDSLNGIKRKKRLSETMRNDKKNDSQSSIQNKNELDPVRYGDWEKDGRCIDF